ncbi:DUF6456 domain-containing protein [Sphingobium baderi]|uniref:DUF6456 domain-containing protein n=1 Tax=Sphingobium baderi LL03 TaxID=1114964 RepID=T0GI38_9SPHN|nr:DUF6456 domain-containing protein [Sphingobium baderi]EQB03396.1 hypothetical protein L485_06405 [Sphingobium baderi LL03]KMS62603.1 hypothetical protein V475_07695 [Sphingobium baderi LL03]
MTAIHVEQTKEDPAGRLQQVTVNLGESPLSWLHARGHLKERHYVAGDMLRADWEKAGLGPRVTMRWDGAPPQGRGGRGRPDPSLAQLSARERFDGAIRAAGPGLADILWRVACAGEGITAAERALGWPSRAGKLVLTLALDRVADWYRVPG